MLTCYKCDMWFTYSNNKKFNTARKSNLIEGKKICNSYLPMSLFKLSISVSICEVFLAKSKNQYIYESSSSQLYDFGQKPLLHLHSNIKRNENSWHSSVVRKEAYLLFRKLRPENSHSKYSNYSSLRSVDKSEVYLWLLLFVFLNIKNCDLQVLQYSYLVFQFFGTIFL